MTEHSSSPLPTSSDQSLSLDELRDVLAGCEGVDLPEPADDDALLLLDSYTAIWIQHVLEEKHGVVVELSGKTSDIDSVRALHAFVNREPGVGQG
ncbi:hypothetical protein PV646_37925 [Streptomyces sp. ID05-26A]|nr:hypothetical protein [Streptomyces sp. ID05-26A]